MSYMRCPNVLQVTPVRKYLFSFKMAWLYGVSTDSRDITHDLLKHIDEHALVLQNNLHKQFCPQALCYNLPVLQLAPVSLKLGK